jgi:hypothetical protein
MRKNSGPALGWKPYLLRILDLRSVTAFPVSPNFTFKLSTTTRFRRAVINGRSSDEQLARKNGCVVKLLFTHYGSPHEVTGFFS